MEECVRCLPGALATSASLGRNRAIGYRPCQDRRVMMRKLFAPAVLAGSLLMAAGLPAQAFAQAEPLSISTVGLTCTNGVCDLGTGNVGTFLNLAISATGGSGPTPFTWKRVSGKLPAGLSMAKFFGVESTEITGTPTKAAAATFTVQITDGAGAVAQ